MASSYTIGPALPADLADACRVLASSRPAAERDGHALNLLSLLLSGEVDPAGLFVARDEAGVVCGAAIGQILPGAMGLVWPPTTTAKVEAIECRLVAAALGRLQAEGVKVAQAFPRSEDRAGIPPLERQGFRLVTRLSLWRRRLTGARRAPPITSRLAFDPIRQHSMGTYVDTLLATYEGSLDCPESSGGRTPRELAAGHGLPPTWGPLGYLARRGETVVGLVMLAPGEAPGVGDLAYLGLVPSARGQGYGRHLVRFALEQAKAAGFHTLTLSVDVRNEPAVRLYRGHGFRPYDWRDVYLALWSGPGDVR